MTDRVMENEGDEGHDDDEESASARGGSATGDALAFFSLLSRVIPYNCSSPISSALPCFKLRWSCQRYSDTTVVVLVRVLSTDCLLYNYYYYCLYY